MGDRAVFPDPLQAGTASPTSPLTHLDGSDLINMAFPFANVDPIMPKLYINPAGNAAG